MKNLKRIKILPILLTTALLTTSANAFVPLLIVLGEFVVTEVSSVAVIGEAIAVGEVATATSTVIQSGSINMVKKIVTRTIKGSGDYRKTALDNTQTKQGGWVMDPYDGKHYRAKDMDVDHIWPKSKGGTNHSWNLIMSSKHTNRSKGNTIDERVIQGYFENFMQFLQK
jgi:hypothetical protein